MQVKVLGAERRRRWSYDEKVGLVEETLKAGETVCGVARRRRPMPFGIHQLVEYLLVVLGRRLCLRAEHFDAEHEDLVGDLSIEELNALGNLLGFQPLQEKRACGGAPYFTVSQNISEVFREGRFA